MGRTLTQSLPTALMAALMGSREVALSPSHTPAMKPEGEAPGLPRPNGTSADQSCSPAPRSCAAIVSICSHSLSPHQSGAVVAGGLGVGPSLNWSLPLAAGGGHGSGVSILTVRHSSLISTRTMFGGGSGGGGSGGGAGPAKTLPPTGASGLAPAPLAPSGPAYVTPHCPPTQAGGGATVSTAGAPAGAEMLTVRAGQGDGGQPAGGGGWGAVAQGTPDPCGGHVPPTTCGRISVPPSAVGYIWYP